MPANPEPPGLPSTGSAVGMWVQVCYLAPGVQWLTPVEVAANATLGEAIVASGLFDAFPALHLDGLQAGVFGKLRALEEGLTAGDRIEIYRPLTVDPKVARARRVAKTRKGGSTEGRKWANREFRR